MALCLRYLNTVREDRQTCLYFIGGGTAALTTRELTSRDIVGPDVRNTDSLNPQFQPHLLLIFSQLNPKGITEIADDYRVRVYNAYNT